MKKIKNPIVDVSIDFAMTDNVQIFGKFEDEKFKFIKKVPYFNTVNFEEGDYVNGTDINDNKISGQIIKRFDYNTFEVMVAGKKLIKVRDWAIIHTIIIKKEYSVSLRLRGRW